MSLANLKDDLLYLVVFGPGFGESIVLRIPPSTWIIVDGCRAGSVVPAAQLLSKYKAKWSCVVLTHPHLDHATGLDAILDLPGSGPVGCAAPSIPNPNKWMHSPDVDQHLRNGVMEHVVSAIRTRWANDASSCWRMQRGDTKIFDDAKITALHPDNKQVVAYKNSGGDPNRIATPLLVEWHSARVLLGSDVVNPDWVAVGKAYPNVHEHAALKIPHHGSKAAINSAFAKKTTESRFWIATPYNKGKKLPRFENAEGLSILLQNENIVHLTGLPRAYKLQGKAPYRTTRQDLRDGRNPILRTVSLPAGLVMEQANIHRAETISCYVAVGIDRNGDRQDIRFGPGSVEVSERGRKNKSKLAAS